LEDRRQIGIVTPREDFDAMAAPRQMTRYLGDVDVLTAAVHSSQSRQRRGVFANHGDAHCHDRLSVANSLLAV
jgi:hypothetical protein